MSIVLCLAIGLPGCAARGAATIGSPSAGVARATDPATAASIATLPVGTRLRVHLADGQTVRGTLMHADTDAMLIAPRARVPEPPVRIAAADVRSFEVDTPSSIGKVLAIAAAAGAGAALGVIMLVAALIDD